MTTIQIDRAVVEGALKALEAMKTEFRALDLPYGSKAYAQGNDACHEIRAALSAPKPEPAWLRAVDEELVSTHIGVADINDDYETAKKKLGELIDWHVQVATDPAINGGFVLTPVS